MSRYECKQIIIWPDGHTEESTVNRGPYTVSDKYRYFEKTAIDGFKYHDRNIITTYSDSVVVEYNDDNYMDPKLEKHLNKKFPQGWSWGNGSIYVSGEMDAWDSNI